MSALAVQCAVKLIGQSFPPQIAMVMGDTVADIACARTAGDVAIAVLTGLAQCEALIAAPPGYRLPDLTHFLAPVPL